MTVYTYVSVRAYMRARECVYTYMCVCVFKAGNLCALEFMVSRAAAHWASARPPTNGPCLVCLALFREQGGGKEKDGRRCIACRANYFLDFASFRSRASELVHKQYRDPRYVPRDPRWACAPEYEDSGAKIFLYRIFKLVLYTGRRVYNFSIL